MIDVRFFAPPADLAHCFTTFYRLEVNVPPGEKLEDWLQPEWGNLRFFTDDPPTAQALKGPRVDGVLWRLPRFERRFPASLRTKARAAV